MDSKKVVKKIFRNTTGNIDSILIRNESETIVDKNFFYVTGLKKGLFENSIAILFPDGEIKLIVSALEAGIAKETFHDVFIYKNHSDYKDILKEILKNSKTIGINYSAITLNFYETLKNMSYRKEYVDVSESLIKTRRIKENFELDIIKKACKITDKVVKKIPDIIKNGIKEYELAAEIDYLMQKNGAEKPAFLTISSFGKNSANPHYSHGNYKLKKNDIILCDFGACFERYNSDITRCFVFGSANKKQKEIYETVISAQKKGIDIISEGIKAKNVHNIVNDYINNTKFKDLFIHSTGHSLGIEVHDPGIGFNSKCDNILRENMVFTVEPGIYIPKFGGIRIEDDVVVKKGKAEILTKANKDLIEI